jgi:soluble lytic murein transglycosylase-like protein
LTILRGASTAVKESDLGVDGKIVPWWMIAILMQAPSTPSSQSQADRIRAAMAKSLASQQASVRRQIAAAGPARTSSNAPPLAAAICEAISQPELVHMIDIAAQREDIDPALVREVARQESGFRPCAVSPKGAEGLMQLMPATQIQLQVQNPFSAQESLEAGSKLLKQLLDRYHGDLPQALSAYNAGPARVDAAGGVPKIPETQNYVVDILKRLMPAQDVQIPDLLDALP